MSWETTKIKTDVKERAKDVDATYTEIMEAGIEVLENGEQATDKEPEEVIENIQETVSEAVEARDEQMQDIPTKEDLEQLKNEISMAADPTVEVDVERIISRIESLETQIENLPENTAKDEIIKKIQNRIDDLESQLPAKVAREIQQ